MTIRVYQLQSSFNIFYEATHCIIFILLSLSEKKNRLYLICIFYSLKFFCFFLIMHSCALRAPECMVGRRYLNWWKQKLRLQEMARQEMTRLGTVVLSLMYFKIRIKNVFKPEYMIKSDHCSIYNV